MWILVVAVVISTVAILSVSLKSHGQDKSCPPNQESKYISEQERQWKEFKSQFPVVDYDSLEIETDHKKRNERVLKNNRYDTKGILTVFSSLPEDGEGLTHSFDSLPFAGIPIIESEIIVVGEILEAEAYLSNNKKGVYSEFTVHIDEVLKNRLDGVTSGSQITFDRIGGTVRYKNGKTRFYAIRPYGMPRVGRRYVLFLKNTEKTPNYELMTGYELKANNSVGNLDDFPQFEEFAGKDAESFLEVIRKTVGQNSKPRSNHKEK